MLLTLLRTFASPQLVHLVLFLSYLCVVLCILLLDFHEDASELYPLIEILKNLLLNALNLLPFLDLSTRTHLPLFSDKSMTRVNRLSLHWLLTLSLCLQFLLQLLYLLSEVINDVFVFTYMDRNQFFVGDCLCLYIFSPIRIFQTIYCLFELRRGGGDIRNHHCFAVATQTVLQQSRQLRVSIRHKKALFVLVAQCVDAISQSKQRSVNFGTLHQSNPSIFCNSAPLRARQINQ